MRIVTAASKIVRMMVLRGASLKGKLKGKTPDPRCGNYISRRRQVFQSLLRAATQPATSLSLTRDNYVQ